MEFENINLIGMATERKGKFTIRLDKDTRTFYPDKEWVSIRPGPVMVTQIKDFGWYSFAIGENLKYALPTGNIATTYLDDLRAMFPHFTFTEIPFTGTAYGDYVVIARTDGEIINIFASMDGKDQSILDAGLKFEDMKANIEGKEIPLQFSKVGKAIREFDRISPVQGYAVLVERGHMIKMNGGGKAYFPDKLLSDDITSGQCIITAVNEYNDRFGFVIAHNPKCVALDDREAGEKAMALMNARHQTACIGWTNVSIGRHGECTIFVGADDTSLRFITAMAKSDIPGNYPHTIMLDEYGYSFDDEHNRLAPVKIDNVRFLTLSDDKAMAGCFGISDDADPALMAFDNATQFMFDIREYSKSDKVYDELLPMIETGIIDVVRVHGFSFDVVNVNWSNLERINMLTREEVMIAVAKISEINATANDRMKSAIKKGKIAIRI